MNRDQIEGNWTQLKGKIKEAWGELTDDEIAMYNGKTERFFGVLQEKHGVARAAAEKRMEELKKSCGCSSAIKPDVAA